MRTKEVSVDIVCCECGQVESRTAIVEVGDDDQMLAEKLSHSQFCSECLGFQGN